MSSMFGNIFRLYGVYILMIVALSGIALVLSDMNSALGGDDEIITCLPNDTSCNLFNETASVAPATNPKAAGAR
jgi:hypothetical protein